MISKLRAYYFKNPTAIFPSILFVFLICMTLLGISGTSIGTIYGSLYGEQSDNPSLVAGHPRAIRSDEFLVNTQLTIAQANAGFPRFNDNINGGRDMSIIVDVPYIDWSIIFKPQNLSFFIMPLENAFAMRWWILVVLLALSAYYFSLYMLRKKVLLSTLLAIIFVCNPFIWWWYQTGTNATLYYGLFIILLCMYLMDQKRLILFGKTYSVRFSVHVYAAILAYLLTCFALILYPPFQIPVVLVALFFLLGYMVSKKWNLKEYTKLIPIAAAGVLALILVVTFVFTRMEAIKAVTNTVYPGERAEGSGGYDYNRLLTTYLQPQLQRDTRGSNYFVNQSESSNFLITPFILLIPSVLLLIVYYRKKKEIEWPLFSLVLCNVLITVHLFIVAFSPFNRIFLLQIAPPTRSIIGYGFLAFITLVYMIYLSEKISIQKKGVYFFAILYVSVIFAVSLMSGLGVAEQFPKFISNPWLILLLSLPFHISIFLLLIRKYVIGSLVLAVFAIMSVIIIHPLYKGLAPITDAKLTNEVQRLSSPNDTWAYSGLIYFENIPQIAKRQAVTGVLFYPNTNFWKKYATDKGQEVIYNRYAHVQLSDTADELLLIQPDLYTVSSRCQMDIIRDIDYIMSSVTVDSACIKLVSKVTYPTATFYFYKVVKDI